MNASNRRFNWMPTPEQDARFAKGNLGVIAWAFFLGTSWTWVIGMCWPALLWRDLGLAGFLAFAIPNVIGASAMGYVLKKPEIAKSLAEKHRPMVLTFSAVTMAFHVYVAVWLLLNLHGPPGYLFLGVATLLAGIFGLKPRGALLWSLVVGCIGLVGMGWALMQPDIFSGLIPAKQVPGNAPALSAKHLIATAPACLGGFLLCPYLDGTFLRARAATEEKTGIWAFILGFCGVFFLMILLSLGYAHVLAPLFGVPDTAVATADGTPLDYKVFQVKQPWKTFLTLHLSLQIGLSFVWHMREIRLSSFEKKSKVNFFGAVLVGITFILALAVTMITYGASNPNAPTWTQGLLTAESSMAWTEVGYRSFLLLYGCIFPAYVALKMLPRIKRTTAKYQNTLWVSAGCLSYIMAWFGFVYQIWAGTLIASAIIVIARIVLELLPAVPENYE